MTTQTLSPATTAVHSRPRTHTARPLAHRMSRALFSTIHGGNLVYNQCWEDPRLDHEAMQLGPDDTVMVITSAGCNTLDYALAAPRQIHAVDVNPRQNALLEIKIAGIRQLDFETFFQIFGRGRATNFISIYKDALRPTLSRNARTFWDSHMQYFTGKTPQQSMYFRGTSGRFARMIGLYAKALGIHSALLDILDAPDTEAQHRIYHDRIRPRFWTRALRWAMDRDATLSLLGVPLAQKEQILRSYPGGVHQFVEHCIERVFCHLSLADNYFWRVYLRGEYTSECCPRYLTREGYNALRGGLLDCIQIHTDTIESFLADNDVSISHFVLLDHMDWLAGQNDGGLKREWNWIIRRSADKARYLYRSGAMSVDYVADLPVDHRNTRCTVSDIVHYDYDLAAHLHKADRVHTYGSFYIGHLIS